MGLQRLKHNLRFQRVEPKWHRKVKPQINGIAKTEKYNWDCKEQIQKMGLQKANHERDCKYF